MSKLVYIYSNDKLVRGNQNLVVKNSEEKRKDINIKRRLFKDLETRTHAKLYDPRERPIPLSRNSSSF